MSSRKTELLFCIIIAVAIVIFAVVTYPIQAESSNLQQISVWLQEAKGIHEDWILYLEAEDDVISKDKVEMYVGDAYYHRLWVDRYSIAIKELKKHEGENLNSRILE